MAKEIIVRNRKIGEDQPLFITAECGVTCNYDMTITKRLIDVVHEAGADAVKFIFWFPEEIMSDKTIQYTYETTDGEKSENMYEMLDKLRFSLDEWREIKNYADSKNIILFSTVNSPSGIRYAEELSLEAYKLSSWDYNYLPLFEKIAAIGKPMILDTGPVNIFELSKVMEIINQENRNNDTIIVHCFHTNKYSEINMNSIPYLRHTFNTLVGYSSPDTNDELDIMAVALGCVFLEKRLTLDRNLPGHHHILSKEPDEFKEYVQLMRNMQKTLGEYTLKPSSGDIQERKKWFRHIVANCDITEGTILTVDMLEAKRPENGISPEYMKLFIGREVKRDLKYNQTLTWDDI